LDQVRFGSQITPRPSGADSEFPEGAREKAGEFGGLAPRGREADRVHHRRSKWVVSCLFCAVAFPACGDLERRHKPGANGRNSETAGHLDSSGLDGDSMPDLGPQTDRVGLSRPDIAGAMEGQIESRGEVFWSQGPALVVVPHPDDEVLGFFSLLRSGVETHVVILTCGDGYDAAVSSWMSCGDTDAAFDADARAALCQVRMGESQEVLSGLGAASVTFLGYPDGQLDSMADEGIAEGLGWSETSFTGHPFEQKYLVGDLVDALAASGAATVFTMDPLDSHPDHSATARFVAVAAETQGHQEVLVTLVHSVAGEDSWPPPACPAGLPPVAGVFARYLPQSELSSPPDWDGLQWEEVAIGPDVAVKKGEAIQTYGSQLGTTCVDGAMPGKAWGCLDPCGYMLAFARTNELFRRLAVKEIPSLR